MNARRLTVAVLNSLCALVGVLLVTSATAFAAAPETPAAEAPVGVRAHSAVLLGVLNPGKEGAPGTYELGTYEFVYRASTKNECEGSGQVVTTTGMSVGGGKEQVFQKIEGLSSGTEYAVCLTAHNEAQTATATSTPVSFTTRIPLETPTGEQATEVTATTAKLQGVLNPSAPGGPGTYQFFYNASGKECRGGFGAPEPAGTTGGLQGETVEVSLTSLLPGTTYTFCLYTENAGGEAAEGTTVTFTTKPAPPVVAEEDASAVGAGTAYLTAGINPHGLPTGYHVEYVSDAQFIASEWSEASRVPATDAELPAGGVSIRVSEHVGGLQPATTYHFRFVAGNSLGESVGPQDTLETTSLSATSSALPDGRVYELVSTSGNEGEPYSPSAPEFLFTTETNHIFQAAENGEALTYLGEPGLSGGNGNVGRSEGNQWLAKRTFDGWKTEVITPRGTEPRSSGEIEPVYQAFSSDLFTGIVETPAQPPLTSDAPMGCQVLYSRDNASGAYRALLTAPKTSGNCGNPLYAGASKDGSKIVFQSQAALTPEAEEATEVPAGHEKHAGRIGSITGESCMFGCNLYERVNGHLVLVNVLPGIEGKTVPNATFGGYPGPRNDLASDFSNAISEDGSRIFWTATQAGPNMEHVYVLENGTTEVQVSGGGGAEYWMATPDGRFAYYTEAGELWRFDTSTNSREALTGIGAGVEGVIGVNEIGEDGSYLYFVAAGVLAANQNANHETATAGQPNLYLLYKGDTTFIATLSPRDDQLQAVNQSSTKQGDWIPNLGDRTARPTPDGRHLVFESVQPLAFGAANEVGRVPDVYVYTAGEAQLACASCAVDGAPHQIQRDENAQLPVSNESDSYMRRWVSEDGNRVFFQTRQPLVSQDTNGLQDVYEWEREGNGTCAVRTVPLANRGCVFLLSGGGSSDLSFLVDADAEGENVFFEHRGPLGEANVANDANEMYDARVNGGFSHPALACTGTGCQGVPPALPIFATPSSVTFNGVGNFSSPVAAKAVVKRLTRARRLAKALKACKKRSKRKRAACERQARKRNGAKAASKPAKSANKGRK